jgi:hypothetical protein
MTSFYLFLLLFIKSQALDTLIMDGTPIDMTSRNGSSAAIIAQ